MIHRTNRDHDCFLMDCKGRTETLARLESDDDWIEVRMTPTLMRAIAEATADGPVSIAWSDPDEQGFYIPIVSVRLPGQSWIENERDTEGHFVPLEPH